MRFKVFGMFGDSTEIVTLHSGRGEQDACMAYRIAQNMVKILTPGSAYLIALYENRGSVWYCEGACGMGQNNVEAHTLMKAEASKE